MARPRVHRYISILALCIVFVQAIGIPGQWKMLLSILLSASIITILLWSRRGRDDTPVPKAPNGGLTAPAENVSISRPSSSSEPLVEVPAPKDEMLKRPRPRARKIVVQKIDTLAPPEISA